MDDIHRPSVAKHPWRRTAASTAPLNAALPRRTQPVLITLLSRIALQTTSKLIFRYPRHKRLMRELGFWGRHTNVRLMVVASVVVLVVTQLIPIFQSSLSAEAYALNNASSLLPTTSPAMAKKLAFNSGKSEYNFNSGYAPAAQAAEQKAGGPLITSTANVDASQGIKVTDPVNNVNLTLKPQFQVKAAKQDSNRLIYPLSDGSGWLVYTMQANQVREDLLLSHAGGDTMKLHYQIDLGGSLATRMMSDGSVGVYGSSLPINGQVSTGSASDAALLQKVRQGSPKNHLLFSLPRPVIRESGTSSPKVTASYSLSGSTLTLNVKGLSRGSYPLDIDPSVYVQSALGLMYGNNETNVNFSTANNLFEKTPVSGGNIRNGQSQTSWSTTTALPTSLWNMGTAISGGYIYVVGGSTASANVATVYRAALDPSTNAIDSWTTNTAYNLPATLSGLSLVAYNDYLFAIGGNSGSATVSTVYKLHIAASGEPTPAWVAATTSLPGGTGLQYSSAVAYQNELYILGGQSAATGTTGLTATYSAPINPDGTLGGWVTTTVLPQALYGLSAATYNGYVYAVGGTVAGTTHTTVYYAKITSPGTLSAWQTTNAFSTGRQSSGGNFVTIWAGYMYLSGGCTTVNASGYCTVTPQGDIQEASINADGSLSSWTTLQYYDTGTSAFNNISQPLLGYGLAAFGSATAGGTLYAIGGCAAALNTGTGACASPNTTTTYATISNEGDIGPAQSTTVLPSGAGKYAAGVVINNGYIYNVGGCTNNSCSTVTGSIYYAPINSNGTIGTWTAATSSMPTALAAMGITVFDNTIYTFGGGTGSANSATGDFIPLSTTGNDTAATQDGTNPLTTAAMYTFAFAHANPATPSQGFVYTVGGCTGSTGIGCSGYVATVKKCTVTAGTAPTGCTTTGQLQLPVATGIAGGAVYGNYAYLSGGANSNTSGTAGSWGGQTNLTYYVQINSSGNLVDPPNQVSATWPTVSATLAANSWSDVSTDNASGQRRRTAAYAVNGYLYVLAGHDANANNGGGKTLQDIEIGKIDPTTGDIASFTDNYYQITPRWDFRGAAANGYIYAVGGCSAGAPPASCTAEDGAVQYMQVYNNYSGSPASYTAASNAITNPVIGGSSAIYNGNIYVAGGTTAYGGTPSTAVQYAPINSDGSIGTWTVIASGTGALTTARMYFKLLANNGYLYAIGGQSGTAVSTALGSTEYSHINPSTGAPGAFTATTSMNLARTGVDAVAYNGYIYASGGENAAGTLTNTVEYSQINTSTGALGSFTTSGNTFTDARMYHMAVAYNGTLYIIGGYDGTNYLGDVQFTQLNSSGTIGTFKTSSNLPQQVSQGSAFAANGYLYVLSGTSGTGTTNCTNNTYVASISANSTVSTGNVPNGLGNWSQTSVSFGGTRYGASASFYGGKAYLFGGSQCATNTIVTSATSSYYAALQSQPQVSQYSYAIDALYDVFPSKTLFNGIDNGIGASWVLDYRSSTQANDSWGADVAYGKTTLGTPQVYTPEDGTGTNTNYARYYWIELTIDDSQAFGYPEDVSRGPTIDNLILQFTANPSQRLRNGKTFINGVQQPLDAPF